MDKIATRQQNGESFDEDMDKVFQCTLVGDVERKSSIVQTMVFTQGGLIKRKQELKMNGLKDTTDGRKIKKFRSM